MKSNLPAASGHSSPSSDGVRPKSDLGLQAQRGSIPLTDSDLLAATSAARGAAHRAPFAEWSKDHTGHSAIVNHGNSWAERGHAFVELMSEVRRRGLEMPPCDCAPGSHDDNK